MIRNLWRMSCKLLATMLQEQLQPLSQCKLLLLRQIKRLLIMFVMMLIVVSMH